MFVFCTAESLDEKQLWRAGTVPPLCMGVSVGAKDSLSLLLIFSFLTNSVSQLYHGRWLKGGFEDPHAPQCPWLGHLFGDWIWTVLWWRSPGLQLCRELLEFPSWHMGGDCWSQELSPTALPAHWHLAMSPGQTLGSSVGLGQHFQVAKQSILWVVLLVVSAWTLPVIKTEHLRCL